MNNYTIKNIIEYYSFDSKILEDLFRAIVAFLKANNVNVVVDRPVTNKFHRSIREVYQNSRIVSQVQKINETYEIPCISDGQTIFLGRMSTPGGMYLRLFDLLHFGCGHLWQWSASEGDGNLIFSGDYAWEVGGTAMKFIDCDCLKLVEAYEIEAGIISMMNLSIILKSFDTNFVDQFKTFFYDFVEADRCSLLHFCEDGQHENLFNFWTFNKKMENSPGERHVNFIIKPRKRKDIQAVFR